MFWASISFVFYILLDIFDGFIGCLGLAIFIKIAELLYKKIKNLIKKKLNEESFRKGLLSNKNVIVTGGSSGIGKCFAILAAEYGANVTIIARNIERLKLARDEIVQACRNKNGQKIECVSLDIGQDCDRVQRTFAELEERQGPCYMLVNCAGTALPAKIEDTNEDMLRCLVDLNLLGSYYCTKAVVPRMKMAKQGKIVIVSSQAGLLGIFGFSAYCSTKFALRGLAESLAMELTPHNISVTLSLPPDTDTPGFAAEEQSKPLETKLISQSTALVQPEIVAKQLMNDVLDGKFFSIVGFESFILTTLCAGMMPYSSFSELIFQSLLMGPLRIISAFYLYSFQNIVKRCMKEREHYKKSE